MACGFLLFFSPIVACHTKITPGFLESELSGAGHSLALSCRFSQYHSAQRKAVLSIFCQGCTPTLSHFLSESPTFSVPHLMHFSTLAHPSCTVLYLAICSSYFLSSSQLAFSHYFHFLGVMIYRD